MLRPTYSIEPNQNGSNPPPQHTDGTGSVDIQQELNQLEEIILTSFRIPLTGRTIVEEEKLLEQLDFIRLSLPAAFNTAVAIIQQKEEILVEAEEYGQQIVDAAQAKRAQILNENDIIHQAEQEAEQLRRQVKQDCEAMMQQTLEKIDTQRRTTGQELEQMQRQALVEADNIAQGADEYADGVLENTEQHLQDMIQQLQEMMQIVRNGRQQLHPNTPPGKNNHLQQRKK